MNVSAPTVSSDAPVMILRKALDAQQSQAQALLQVLPPPAPVKGRYVDVRA